MLPPMRQLRPAYFASFVALGLLSFACSGTETTTSGTTSTGGSGGTTGTAGPGGSGGAGGEGGGSTCLAPFVSKGPWALAVDEASAKVRWEACQPDTDAGLVFMPEESGPEQTVTAEATAITLQQTYTAPLNDDAPPDAAGTYYTHEAVLTGLEQGTCYAYSLAADPSRKGRFCTARAAGEDLEFMAIGDTNPGLGFTAPVLEHVLAKGFDFTIHGGDIQYYDSGFETWSSWFPVMQPMLSQGAFFPAIGNHESEKFDELATYALRFFGGAGFDGGETYYRFQNAGVHFFSLNTEESIGQGSAQATWLESRLAEVSALPGFRFSVVFMHRPLLTCGDSGDDPTAYAWLEPVFVANGVTLVLQAHMHGYERFEPASGVTYVTTAGGGGLMGDVDENLARPYCGDRVAAAGKYHAMVFELGAATLTGTAIDKDGAVIDTFVKDVP